MTIGLVTVTLMLPTAFASAGHFAQFCFMASWAGGFTVMWLNRNKRGYRPEDHWVAVSADGLCVVSWRYTWKGHREVVERFAYSSIASVTINDDIDMPPVTLELADGGSRAIDHVMLADRQQLMAFCDAVRSFSPSTSIINRS